MEAESLTDLLRLEELRLEELRLEELRLEELLPDCLEGLLPDLSGDAERETLTDPGVNVEPEIERDVKVGGERERDVELVGDLSAVE